MAVITQMLPSTHLAYQSSPGGGGGKGRARFPISAGCSDLCRGLEHREEGTLAPHLAPLVGSLEHFKKVSELGIASPLFSGLAHSCSVHRQDQEVGGVHCSLLRRSSRNSGVWGRQNNLRDSIAPGSEATAFSWGRAWQRQPEPCLRDKALLSSEFFVPSLLLGI